MASSDSDDDESWDVVDSQTPERSSTTTQRIRQSPLAVTRASRRNGSMAKSRDSPMRLSNSSAMRVGAVVRASRRSPSGSSSMSQDSKSSNDDDDDDHWDKEFGIESSEPLKPKIKLGSVSSSDRNPMPVANHPQMIGACAEEKEDWDDFFDAGAEPLKPVLKEDSGSASDVSASRRTTMKISSSVSTTSKVDSAVSSDSEDNWDSDFGFGEDDDDDSKPKPLKLALPKQNSVSSAKSSLASNPVLSPKLRSSGGNDGSLRASSRSFVGHRKGIISATRAAEELANSGIESNDPLMDSRANGSLQRKEPLRHSVFASDGLNDDELGSVPTITGIKANPAQVESGWDDDFDFGDDGTSDQPLQPLSISAPSTPARLRSTSKDMSLVDDVHGQFGAISSEGRDFAEARFLLQSIPEIPRSFKDSGDNSLWFHCSSDHVFPPWFTPNDSPAAMRKACDLWKQGIALSSQNVAGALGLFRQILSLFDDYNGLSPMNVCFVCLVMLHIASLAKQMGDIFEATEKLHKGVDIVTSEFMNSEPYSVNPTLASMRAALYYELAQITMATSSESALPYALKVLRTFIMTPGKNVVSKSLNWNSVAQACELISNCLQNQSRLQGKFLAKSQEIIRAKNDSSKGLVTVPSKISHKRKVSMTSSQQSSSSSITAQTGPNKSQGTKDTDTTDTTSEMDEDWDAEFGIELERPAGFADALFSQNQQGQNKPFSSAVPARYKLLDQAMNNSVNIVKFPPPSHFFSMKTANGYTFLHAEDLEDWLYSIVIKRFNENDLSMINISSEQERVCKAQEVEQQYKKDLENVPQYSPAYFELTVKFARNMRVLDGNARAWDIIHHMICVEVKDFIHKAKHDSTKKVRKSWRKGVFLACAYALTQMATFWDLSLNKEWQEILKICRVVLPSYADIFTVLELNGYAETFLSGEDEEIDRWVSEGFSPDPFQGLYDVYKQSKARDSTLIHDGRRKSHGALLSMASALCSLHLASCCIGPQLCTLNESYPEEDALNEILQKDPDIATPDARDKLLRKLYYSLPVSVVKSKVAFTLAQNCVEKDNWDEAEKLLFEALYITDILNEGEKGSSLPMIDTALGLQILIKYGDVLLHNNKYKFASSCYYAAIFLCDISKHKEYFKLVRTVAEIAREKDDFSTCLDLYDALSLKYLAKNKVNEARYVFLLIAEIFEERGDFADAEDSFTEALRLMCPTAQGPNPSSCIDSKTLVADSLAANPQIVSFILLKLSQMLLNSFDSDRGISLLETLRGSSVPESVQIVAVFSLAKAFSKKGWFSRSKMYFDEFLALAQKNRDLLDQQQFDSRVRLSNNDKSNSVSSRVMAICKILIPYGTLFINSGKYTEALKVFNVISVICPETLLYIQGVSQLRRGDILRALYRDSSAYSFPTAFYDETDVPELKSFLSLFGFGGYVPSVIFRRNTDVLQEAAKSYRNAYTFFHNLGDDAHVARTMASLAELYLDHVFVRSVLFRVPLEDYTSMPFFSSSPSDSQKDSEFTISLSTIENPARVALDIASDTVNIQLLTVCLVNMAEYYYLAGDKDTSQNYWKECRDLVWSLYMDGPLLMVKSGPVYFVEEVTLLLKRLARLLLCYGREFIGRNIVVLDAFLLAQIDLKQAQRRPLQKSYQLSGTSDITSVPIYNRVKELSGEGSSSGRNSFDGSVAPLAEALTLKSGCLPKSIPSPTLPPVRQGSSSSSSQSESPAEPALPPPIQSGGSSSAEVGKSESSSAKKSGTEKSSSSTNGKTQQRKRALSVVTPKPRPTSLMVLSPVDKNGQDGNQKPDRAKRLSCGPQSLVEEQPLPENVEEKCDDAGYEAAGEYIWGILSFIRQNLNKFYSGTLKKDELVSRNTSLLRTLVTVVAAKYRRMGTILSLQNELSRNSEGVSSLPAGVQGSPYSFESFSVSYPNVANRTLYLLVFDSIVGYFAPATGKVHFERLEYPPKVVPARGCEQPSDFDSEKGDSEKPSEGKKDGNSKGGSFVVRIHTLQKSDEYAFMSISRECTISDMLEELCHCASDIVQAAFTSPRSESSKEGSSDGDSSHGASSQKSSDTIIKSRVESMMQKRAKVIKTTSAFWKELQDLGKNVVNESIDSGSSHGHRRSMSYQFRLNSSVLALARLAQNSAPSGDLPFIPINQPRSAKVTSCFTQKELEVINDGDALSTGLYVYANSRADDVTCSFVPRTLSPVVAEFMQALLGRKPADSIADISSSSCIAVLCELNAMFQSLRDLLPLSVEIVVENPPAGDLSRKKSVPGSKLIGGAAQSPPVTKSRFNSLRTLFRKERKTNQIKNVSRNPILLLVSQPFQVIPWESLFADEVVLRYMSFFDVVQRSVLAERDPTELRVSEPVYTSFFYRATEQVVSTCEKARQAYQCSDVLSQLHVTVESPEISEDSSAVGCLQSPLVETTKRGIIIPRKKRYLEFVDMSSLATSPDLFWAHFSVHNHQFPVILVPYSDTADPPKLLTTILRYRPCTAVIGVPTTQMKSVVQKLCSQHEAALNKYQNTVVVSSKLNSQPGSCDRYQFLLSVIAAVRAESMTHVCLMNCPLPLPSFAYGVAH